MNLLKTCVPEFRNRPSQTTAVRVLSLCSPRVRILPLVAPGCDQPYNLPGEVHIRLHLLDFHGTYQLVPHHVENHERTERECTRISSPTSSQRIQEQYYLPYMRYIALLLEVILLTLYPTIIFFCIWSLLIYLCSAVFEVNSSLKQDRDRASPANSHLVSAGNDASIRLSQ